MATTAYIKKIIRIGGSLAIILPTEWAKGKVQPGEEMVVIGNGELRIFPAHLNIDGNDSAEKTRSDKVDCKVKLK